MISGLSETDKLLLCRVVKNTTESWILDLIFNILTAHRN